nr:MAG TPA: hypothetical protein [Caudoviricetes sp.]DAZ30984.1 MAG TPA: hypothetical protein [Caudoviricetes sp.]
MHSFVSDSLVLCLNQCIIRDHCSVSFCLII